MNEEELNSIQELIERKIALAEVTVGLTSSDKKFIALWNYSIQLQNNWNELKKWLETTKLKEFEKTYGKRYGKTFTQAEIVVFNMIKEKMQELEQVK